MDEQIQTKEIKYKFTYHLGRRIMALFLALILMGGMILVWQVQIRESGLRYAGTILERAQQVTQNNTGYLEESLLERAWRVLKASVPKPRGYEEYDTYASLAIAKGEYAEAVKYMQGCIDFYSGEDANELANLWLRKGSLYTLSNQYTDAIECYNKCLELNPASQDAFLLRAQMKSELGDSTGAIQDLNAYENLAGENPIIQAALGGLYEEAQSYDKAIECYTIAIDSGNYELAALSSRARCLILEGDSAGGKEDLERFFSEGGTDSSGDYYAMLGMCRVEADELPGAVKAFHEAIRMGYIDPFMLYNQCVACAYATADYDTVIHDGEAAIKIAPKYEISNEVIGDLYQWVAFAYFAKNEFEAAADSFMKALGNDPTLEFLNYYAGICYMSTDKLEEAIACFRESALRKEHSSISLYDSALCLIQSEKYSEAVEELEAAIDANDSDEAVQQSKLMLEALAPYLSNLEDKS